MQQKNIKLVQEFEQLIQLIQNPKIYLSNYFSYIRNEVDLAYFERKSNLNNEQSSIKIKAVMLNGKLIVKKIIYLIFQKVQSS